MRSNAPLLRFGPFVLDVAEHSLKRDGEPIALTPKLFELLQILATSGGRLLKKDALMKAVWPETVVEEGNLSKGIFHLRQALGDTDDDRRFIETVPRVGYRFVAPVTSAGEPAEAPTLEKWAPTRDEPLMGETRYAKSGDVHIAYQVIGKKGRPDLVLVPGWVSHVEYAWEDPAFSAFLRRLASFSRLIILDRRGCGLSDAVTDMPSLELRMDDVRAVMDEAESEEATLFGISEGGPMCMLYAATYPERTRALALFGTAACWLRSGDYQIGIPRDALDKLVRQIGEGWGTGVSADLFAPSVAKDDAFRKSWARFERFAVSPAGIQKLIRMLYEIDVRHVLPAVRVPTLVIHREGDRAMRADGARYIAQHVKGAKYVELPGADHFPFVGDVESIVREVEDLVTNAGGAREPDRVLATILCSEVVAPNAGASSGNDARLRELLAHHEDIAGRELARLRGRRVKSVGRGFVATFDGPARAIRCACAIREAARRAGIELRAGLHAGECELLPDDIGGVAVEICSNVAANAAPGEVLVTHTVKDLIAGSHLRFADRGTRRLHGATDEWRLFAAEV